MSFDHPFRLLTVVDCVVMLTWSDWHTEPRSNRYHYATRFAKHVPVVFVQPDLDEEAFRYEPTHVQNLDILHVCSMYGPAQNSLLNQALLSRGFIKPLLWIYNCYFVDYIFHRYAPLQIYHATEDYFSPDLEMFGGDQTSLQKALIGVLSQVDLVVAVSEGVAHSYRQRGHYTGELLVLNNGCDYDFWAPSPTELQAWLNRDRGKPIAFYQGGINFRLDFALLKQVIGGLPEYEFWFCGKDADAPSKEWRELRRLPNVKYWGQLSPDALRRLAQEATVGIIPFVQIELMAISFPLKAFEYVASGLPVVSMPIASLLAYPELFYFARTPQEFIEGIRTSVPSRYDARLLEKRLKAAQAHGCDHNFETLLTWMATFAASKQPSAEPFNLLVLYDDRSTHVPTVQEHLESLGLYSRNRVFYAVATLDGMNGTYPVFNTDLSLFDVVVMHYSVRVSTTNHLAPACAEALIRFGGLKILFVQDDYDTTEITRQWIDRLGMHVIFTIVPAAYFEAVYPSARYPHVEFVETLTGYVPRRFETPRAVRPMSERKLVIGYRGRRLPFWYGNLGQEKLIIGQQMRHICEERKIPVDIEWEEDKRIYGEHWYEFLENCKATLGTESGANIFDFDGSLRQSVERLLANNPTVSYQEVFETYLAEHEGKIIMNQVSPRIFEALVCRTALVLFEGSYSGVVKPHVHYIPLKKDFSNIDEVLDKLGNDHYLERLTERAYNDVIASSRYSYKRFVQAFNEFTSQRLKRSNGTRLVSGLVGCQTLLEPGRSPRSNALNPYGRSIVTSTPLLATTPTFASASPMRETEAADSSPADTTISVLPLVTALALADVPASLLAQELGCRFRLAASRRLAPYPVLFRPMRVIYTRVLRPFYHGVRSPRESHDRIKLVVRRRLAHYPMLFHLSRWIYRRGVLPLYRWLSRSGSGSVGRR